MDGIAGKKPYQPKQIDYASVPRLKIDRLDCTPEEAGIDVDKFQSTRPSPREQERALERLFRTHSLSRNEGMYADYKKIEAECQNTIASFYDGNISEDELGTAFSDLMVDFMEACDRNNYPTLLGVGMGLDKIAAKTFYAEFRRSLLSEAVKRNNEEGKQYVTKNADTSSVSWNAQPTWKYYNSDYYYKSESAISAVTDSLMQFADAMEYEDFTLPDYKAEKSYLYYNFNSALENPFQLDRRYFSDFDQVPPENFQWFTQSGYPNGVQVKIISVYLDDTPIYIAPEDKSISFDPSNPDKGTTWVSFLDESGKKQFISCDFRYEYIGNDLQRAANNYHKASDFLLLDGKSEQINAANEFLKNLWIYPAGYLENPELRSFSVKV